MCIKYLGGWNLSERASEWTVNDSQFIKEKLLSTSISNAFFTQEVNIDLKNSSRYILYVCDAFNLGSIIMLNRIFFPEYSLYKAVCLCQLEHLTMIPTQ